MEFLLADACPVLVVDDPAVVAAEGYEERDPGIAVLPDQAAYVLYTSGSTGRPKGVTVTHAGVADLVATQTERLALTRDSRVLQFASPSFDASFWELCASLLTGATLVLSPTGSPLDVLTGSDRWGAGVCAGWWVVSGAGWCGGGVVCGGWWCGAGLCGACGVDGGAVCCGSVRACGVADVSDGGCGAVPSGGGAGVRGAGG
ncbi:AMP-binding protein [Streptomyces sp. NRRL S-1868]|uniref:AMP-binding protein n=1 Tax=Streptomyces sp. NRRL S-1868 TaxID=1463892 RepID=UPI00099C8D91|nr:AMP-binding protein [Streptomyces sp. NRRL S-1868]